MADIATVFHWQPNVFDDMDLSELMQWHEKAHQRAETQT
nr:GpE family phage tail protein [Pasteurella bettyae]